MSISITVNKDEIFKINEILQKTISDKLKEDNNFFNKSNLLICNNQESELLDDFNIEKLLLFLSSKLKESIKSKIKKETFTSLLSVSKLKNTSNNVDYLYITLDCKINNEIISLLDYKIYSYNKDKVISELLDFANTNNFNDDQKLFLEEYIEETKPDSIHLDNFIYIFEEALTNSLNIQHLSELLEATIESAFNYDYSKDIYNILIKEDCTLNLFKDKLKVSKCENGYNIYLGDRHLKNIQYKLSFI